MKDMKGHNMSLRTELACKEDNLTEEELRIVRFIYQESRPYCFLFGYEIRDMLKGWDTEADASDFPQGFKIYGGHLQSMLFPHLAYHMAIRGCLEILAKEGRVQEVDQLFVAKRLVLDPVNTEEYLDKLYEKLTKEEPRE